MPDINPNLLAHSGRRSDSTRSWSAMRRLSEQLTEATLAAMQKADARCPAKPLLDVPILACPKCHAEDPFFLTDPISEPQTETTCVPGLHRYGRSKSVALSVLDRSCNCCGSYFYQNPLKDTFCSRHGMHSAQHGLWHQRRSLHSRTASITPVDMDDIPMLSGLYNDIKPQDPRRLRPSRRRSSSLIQIPATSSQHTQTIFSSIMPTIDVAGATSKPRSRLKSGSMYIKQATGLRFQLPTAFQRTKSYRKRGLDFGLRKTLSVTNAIVRMPIESATASSSKKNLNAPVGSSSKDNIAEPVTYKLLRNQQSTVISNEPYATSDSGSMHSLPLENMIASPGHETDDLEKSFETSEFERKHSLSDGFLDRPLAPGYSLPTMESLDERSEEIHFKVGKRDVILQTMEDFEKEMQSSFNIPRILNEEDRTKEPRGSTDWESVEGLDDNAKQSTKEYWKEQFLTFFQPSDNKLAKKLFGTKVALNKERSRQRKQGKWIIHPASNFRFYWDLLMLVLLIANLIILPVLISFFLEDLGIQAISFNCISDTIFLLDILVNFRTGILRSQFGDEIILNPKKIAQHYLRTWFVLDLLSSIPLDYIFLLLSDEAKTRSHLVGAGRALRILRLVKLLGLLRLLRITRLVRYVSQWEEFLNVANKFMGIFNLVLLMLLLGHWNACLQFFIPMLNNFPVDSWVIKCKLKDAGWFEQYTWALFKAMSHMLSIGYGRFPPTSAGEAWITIVSMMTGSTCYALFVGHAAALIQSFDCSKKMYREKFKQVEEYMAYRKLPRVLRQKIANYYEHRYQGKIFNEMVILDELSECLREQIVGHNCRALVAAVPFFTYADRHFVSEVLMKLKYEVFQPGDWIIKEGQMGSKMYFIQEGIVDIVDTDGRVATSLSDGSYFGEICLLTNARRVASVRAETYCNLYALDRTSFQDVLQNYPFMRRTLESVAAERLHQLGRDPLQVIHRKNLEEDLEIVKEIVSQAEKNLNGIGSTSSFSCSNSEKATHSDTNSSEKSHAEGGPSSWSRTFRNRLYQRKSHGHLPSTTMTTTHEVAEEVDDTDVDQKDQEYPPQEGHPEHESHQPHYATHHSYSGNQLHLDFRRSKNRFDRRANRRRHTSGAPLKLLARKSSSYVNYDLSHGNESSEANVESSSTSNRPDDP